MKVEIWSDYQCPFCYIGKRRFEKALSRFGAREEVEVIYRSFELDPSASREIQMNMHDMLAVKYGITAEQAKAQTDSMAAQGKAEGLELQFDKVKLTNSFDAHRLMHFASSKGKQTEINDALFQAYFTDSKHIGDQETLADVGAGIGLDRAEVMSMLAGNAYADEVRRDEQQGSRLGITGVPFFVINEKYGISGAQPEEAFLRTLEKIREEEQPLRMLNDETAGSGCSDGFCKPGEKE